MTSLNTMSQAKSYDNASLRRTLRCCTVANTLSIGFGAQVVPVLGREVVEGQQRVAVLVLITGISLLREVQEGSHPPRYTAFLTQPSPILWHGSGLSARQLPQSPRLEQLR